MLPKKFSKPNERRQKPAPQHISSPAFEQSGLEVYVLIGLFFASAFCSGYYLQFTLVPLLAASRIFASVGLLGFLICYFFRKKFNLGILDGLFYNFFGTAPFALAMLLVINSRCDETFTETHRIDHNHPDSTEDIFFLENDAYTEFLRIRNYKTVTEGTEKDSVIYTFCNGVLGYKVLKQAEFE